jgi:DNA-binding SARP family transcriptional activator
MLTVRMLGQLSLYLDEKPLIVQSRPAQSLLALLMLTAGVAHRREQLAGMLWPNSSDSNARDYLRHELWRLNHALQNGTDNAGFFIVNKISIAFNPSAPYWLDARQLAETSARTDASIEDQIAAAFLYQGELLPGFYEDWVSPYRAQANAFFDMLMPRLLSHLRDQNRFKDAVHASQHWIAHGELPENAYRELMLAHYGLNDQAAIRRDMEACAAHLLKHYGARPSRLTVELYQRLINEQHAGV